MKDGALKCKKPSEAADELACEPILVDGVYLRRFECVIGECDTCKDKYEPVEFEKDCDQTIAYQLYVSVRKCTWHGDGNIEAVEGTRSHVCKTCSSLSPEEIFEKEKTKKKAKINHKKYRSKYCESMSQFVKIDGALHKVLKNY